MRIRTLGPDAYQLVWELPRTAGKRREKTEVFHGPRRKAEKRWREFQREIDQGHVVAQDRVPTCNALWDRWFEEILPMRNLSPVTVAVYREQVDRYLRPVWGSKPVTALTTAAVQAFLTGLYRSGGRHGQGLAASHVRGLHLRLSVICAMAVEEGILTQNPVDRRRLVLPTDERRQPTIWTPDQAQRFLTHALSHRLGLVFLLDLSTGLRLGEILAMTWAQLRWDPPAVAVTRTLKLVNGRVQFGKPKTSRSRRGVPIPQAVADRLIAWRHQVEDQPGWSPQSLLFAKRDGSPLHPNYLRQIYYQLQRESIVPEVPMARFHDMRHMYASWLITEGVALPIVRDLLGHQSIQTTADIYGHMDPHAAADASTRLDRYVTVGSQG